MSQVYCKEKAHSSANFTAESWTKEEEDILRRFYKEEGRRVADRLPRRNVSACLQRAHKLGLTTKHSMPWTAKEREILVRYYPVEGTKVIRRLPGRTLRACKSRVEHLGLTYIGPMVRDSKRHTTKVKVGTEWTEDCIAVLKEHYVTDGAEACAALLNRSVAACRTQASKLGIAVPRYREWTMKEISFLEMHYRKEGAQWCADSLDRTVKSCRVKACALGISSRDRKDWSEKELDILKSIFPVQGAKKCSQLTGRDENAVRLKASRLGLKSPATIDKLMTTQQSTIF